MFDQATKTLINKKANKKIIAVNGPTLFPVCNKADLYIEDKITKCKKIDFIRYTELYRKTYGLGWNDKVLLGKNAENDNQIDFNNITNLHTYDVSAISNYNLLYFNQSSTSESLDQYRKTINILSKLEVINLKKYNINIVLPTKNIMLKPNLFISNMNQKNDNKFSKYDFNFNKYSHLYDDQPPIIYQQYNINDLYDYLRNQNVKTMFGGEYPPHYIQNVEILDKQCSSHLLQVMYAKSGKNNWSVEIVPSPKMIPEIEINHPLDAIFASGNIVFDAYGKYKSSHGNITEIKFKIKNLDYQKIRILFTDSEEMKFDGAITQLGGMGLTGYLKKCVLNGQTIPSCYQDEIVNNPENIVIDSNIFGYFTDYKIDQEGKLYLLNYKGEKQHIYSIPMFSYVQKNSYLNIHDKHRSNKNIQIYEFGTNLPSPSSSYIVMGQKIIYKNQKNYTKYDLPNKIELIEQKNAITANEDYLVIKCEVFKNDKFYVKSFAIDNIIFLKDKNDCYLQGINLINGVKYKDSEHQILESEIQRFEPSQYNRIFLYTTKIDMGNLLFDKSTKVEEKTYNPLNKNYNIANGVFTSSFRPLIVSVIDKKGESHPIYIGFIKLSDNDYYQDWAVEIYRKRNKIDTEKNLLIAHGKIKFYNDNLEYLDNKLRNIELNKNMGIKQVIKIDWGDNNNQKIKLVSSKNMIVKNPYADGVSTSSREKIYIENDTIFGVYKKIDNPIPLFQIIFAEFEDETELIKYPGTHGLYPTADSGAPSYYLADDEYGNIVGNYTIPILGD